MKFLKITFLSILAIFVLLLGLGFVINKNDPDSNLNNPYIQDIKTVQKYINKLVSDNDYYLKNDLVENFCNTPETIELLSSLNTSRDNILCEGKKIDSVAIQITDDSGQVYCADNREIGYSNYPLKVGSAICLRAPEASDSKEKYDAATVQAIKNFDAGLSAAGIRTINEAGPFNELCPAVEGLFADGYPFATLLCNAGSDYWVVATQLQSDPDRIYCADSNKNSKAKYIETFTSGQTSCDN